MRESECKVGVHVRCWTQTGIITEVVKRRNLLVSVVVKWDGIEEPEGCLWHFLDRVSMPQTRFELIRES